VARSIAIAMGLVVAALGAIGIVSPDALLGIVRPFATTTGLVIGGALRVAFGTALVLAAPDSHAPRVLRIAGIAIVAAGLVTPLVGGDRAAAGIDWWAGHEPVAMRLFAAGVLAIGGLLLYGLLPAPRRT
jgi:hypothetical protein